MQPSHSPSRWKDTFTLEPEKQPYEEELQHGDDADMRQMIAEETLKAELARMIYEARTAAGLTQQALAARVSTKPSVIARIEDADMDGTSLPLLYYIATALGQALDIRLIPVPAHRQSA